MQTNGLVSTPQVSVAVKEQHSQPITVIGAVKTPMVIQAVRKTTLLQALSQAGGIADDAGTTVIVTRPVTDVSDSSDPNASPAVSAPQTFTINLADLLEAGDSRFNIPLIGGDVVSVPRAGIIYVVGAVNHPGGFVMQNDLRPHDHAEDAVSGGRNDEYREDEERRDPAQKSGYRASGTRFLLT